MARPVGGSVGVSAFLPGLPSSKKALTQFSRCWIGEWRASGLSGRVFCDRRGLATTSFYAWQRAQERRAEEAGRLLVTPSDGPHSRLPEASPPLPGQTAI